MTDEDESKDRLSRWSKRKLAVAREEALEREVVAAKPVPIDERPELDAERDAELTANREAAEAVDLGTLDEESDFSVFMKAGVPDMLKKQAMARLWRASPIFANVDGLVDYDDDFGSPDLIMKTFESAYQAGRGYLDLFKEDEETLEDDFTVAMDSESSKSDSEAGTSADEDSEEVDLESLEDATDEANTVNTDDTEGRMDEPIIVEAMPGVSLRKRLELDQSS